MDSANVSKDPKRLGDFEILHELGRGGMGVVYEAKQTSLNRRVALKVLSTGLGLTTKAVMRFKREAEAAAKLHHTNIVPIYATGEENRTPYYAMELVDGPSLDQVIRHLCSESGTLSSGTASSGTLDSTHDMHGESPSDVPDWVSATIGLGKPGSGDTATSSPATSSASSSSSPTRDGNYYDNLARMMAAVADALAHAHDQGVIHRDIKPSNLLLSSDGRLSVNDFGLARMLEQPGMTMSGELMGSPMYMSPEQIAAGRLPLDHRTDIYSLGATLYELLTLQPPFDGRQRDQVLSQIVHKEPTRPRAVNKRIPKDLETICLKAMEKDPDRRYPTAEQMADDLRRYANRHAILARRVGPLGKTVKWVRRRPAVAGLLACVFVVGMVAMLFAFQARQAQLAQRAADGQKAIDDALRKIFSDQLGQVEQDLDRAEASGVDPGRVTLLRAMTAHHLNKNTEALGLLKSADKQLENSMATKVLLEWTYLWLGDIEMATESRKAYLGMTPRTPEDYLYAGVGFTDMDYDQAIDWLEELAAKYPLPRVHYFLGRAHHWKLVNTYSALGIDRTIQVVNAAQTTLPGNIAALRRHAGAHLTAADIFRLQGMEENSQYHVGQAKKTADYMLTHYPDVAMTYNVNTQLAAFEEEWETALRYAGEANKRAKSVDDSAALVSLLYRAGKVPEAIEAFDQLPDGIKNSHGVERVLYVAEWSDVDQAIAFYDKWFRELTGDHLWYRAEYVYSTFAILGSLDQAKQRSVEYLDRIGPPPDPDDFTTAMDRFTRGEMEVDELIGAAETRFERMRAHFLKGCNHLAKGDRKAAVTELELVEREGIPSWGIYIEDTGRRAAVLLNRMRQDPSWPPWND